MGELSVPILEGALCDKPSTKQETEVLKVGIPALKVAGYPALVQEALPGRQSEHGTTRSHCVTYWSLHAKPHCVSTHGILRYRSTNCLLNSVKLQKCSIPFVIRHGRSLLRVDEVSDYADFLASAFLDPCGHVKLTTHQQRDTPASILNTHGSLPRHSHHDAHTLAQSPENLTVPLPTR